MRTRDFAVSCIACIFVLSWTVPASAAILGHWKLDEGTGTTVEDISGNGNNGEVEGAEWVPGISKSALQFDGVDDRVAIPDNVTLHTATGDITLAAWVKVTATPTSAASIIHKNGGYQWAVEPAGNLWFGVWGGALRTTDNYNFNDHLDEWHHVAVTFVEATDATIIYVDGAVNSQGSITAAIDITTNVVYLGHKQDGGGYFNGTIDEAFIADTAYTQEEILALMKTDDEKSADPQPEEDATDVSRDVILSWTAGELAAEHDVYFGTDYDDVNNATSADATYMGRQAENSYDPGILTLGETYYWRVDEVNSPPDSTVFKGDVWSFEVEPASFAVPVGAVTATATSMDGLQDPNNTVNGSGLNENDEHLNLQQDMWLSASDDTNPSIQFAFEKVLKLEKVHVWNHNTQAETILGFGFKEALIEASVDGETWTEVGTFTLGQATGGDDYPGEEIALGGIVAKMIKVTGLSNFSILGLPQKGLSEVRFYAIPMRARREVPATGAIDVAPLVNLSWRSGRQAARHEVLVGTDPDALAPLTTVDDPAYTATADLETTVYWQVNEVNEAGDPAVWAGDLWSFTTSALISVDDMESYQSKDGAWIWETWTDGFDDDDNGALLGHNNGNDMEADIVHGGDQSLPYHFGQGGNGTSEATVATADLEVGQDWTIGAPETLVLRIRGDLNNAAADQLYLKISDTRVPYEGDLVTPIWQQWNVDLASLGIDLTAVSTLIIGVESSGSGVFYVDDVALYRMAPPIVGPPAGSDKSLVGHWTLDEITGLTAADSSGYGNDGTLVAMEGTEWTPGLRDGALAFDGNGQYIDCDNPTSLQLAANLTLSAWVKMEPDNQDAYMGIAGKMVANPYAGFGLVRHNTNVFRFWVANPSGADLAPATSDDTYTDTEWHHLVGVVNDNTSSLYVDGVKQFEEAPVNLTDTGDFAFVGKQYSNTDERYWNGLVDDVRIYYRVLSEQEISDL